jgi:hypothetical protein
MIKLRVGLSAVIASAIVTIGITMAVAAPAYAQSQIPDGTDVYCGYIHNGSDYLDDYGGGSGAYVHTYGYTGSNNQHWCLEVDTTSGPLTWFIHPLNDLSGFCLDSHTDNNYQPIWVYTCNNSGPQLWDWDWSAGGYIVRETNSAMALHDNGLYNEVTIQQGSNNKWTFSDVQECDVSNNQVTNCTSV